MGLWSGPELDSFRTVAAEWEHEEATTVEWIGSQDLRADLERAISRGEPPDLVVLPNPGLLHEFAADGSLTPLGTVLDLETLQEDYGNAWLGLGSHDGTPYAIPYKVTDKSSIWYDPAEFQAAGHQVPSTWNELIELADQMVERGRTPFSVVAPASPAAGWALTDWIAQLVLAGCGTSVYDAWVSGTTSWTDPCVVAAFDRFRSIVHTDGYVAGGVDGIERTTDAAGSYAMYTDPPTAEMYFMASFAQAFIAERFPELTPGVEYDVFPFPVIEPDVAGATMVGADLVVMTHDAPVARSFLGFLAGPESHEAWITLGGFTSVNRRVELDTYPDAVARHVAEHLTSATDVRFAAGDLMPFELQRAWWAAMLDLLEDPDRQADILVGLDAVST